MTDQPHIIVVGAGIIGASIAWHLARDRTRVTIIDAAEPGGVATRASWAWINASWGNPEAYFRLRIRSMTQWRRLEREVPGVEVAWTGGLLWDLPPDELDACAREHSSWGCGIRRVGHDEARGSSRSWRHHRSSRCTLRKKGPWIRLLPHGHCSPRLQIWVQP